MLYISSKATTFLQFSRHEKFFGLFVCFLMTDVMYSIPIAFCWLCFRPPPHRRCNSLHFSGFFAISISLRFCRFLVYQFGLFLITGVLSHCYTFSLKATTLLQFSRHEKSIYSFVPGRCYSLHFYYFYMPEILLGTIALASFSPCVCVPASSSLFLVEQICA